MVFLSLSTPVLYYHCISYLKFHQEASMVIKEMESGESQSYIQMLDLSLFNL